jgi:myosin heavy subunit
MVIMVNVPDELAAQAQMRGVPLEEFVEQLLAEQVAARSAQAVQPRTPEQIRSWLDSLAQFSNKIPPLPDVVTREWIYQDHD